MAALCISLDRDRLQNYTGINRAFGEDAPLNQGKDCPRPASIPKPPVRPLPARPADMRGEQAQSGTFTGNPPAVMTALAAVNELTSPGFYDHIYEAGGRLCDGLVGLFERAGVPARVQGLGARFGIFFGFTDPVERFDDSLNRDQELTGKFIRACADKGVYFHDYGTLVAGHHGVSAQHTLDDIDEALNRIESALYSM